MLYQAGIVLFSTLQFLHPFRILQFISECFHQINTFTTNVHLRTRRRPKLLQWLRDTLPPGKQVRHLTAVWRDGTILCDVIQTVVSGSCTEKLRKHHCHKSIQHGQILAARHLNVQPVFSNEDLHQVTFSSYLERRLVRYLINLRSAIFEIKQYNSPIRRHLRSFRRTYSNVPEKDLAPIALPIDCVVKGMGLVVAVQGRRASFYIYMLQIPISFPSPLFDVPDIVVRIQGPNDDYGEVIIHNMQAENNKTQPGRSRALLKPAHNIPINYCLTPTRIKVNYVPHSPGLHEMSVLRRGQHVPGSPFSVSVDRKAPEAIKPPPSGLLSEDEDSSKAKPALRRLRVIVRIVDFVTEKMILTEEGNLQKLPDNMVPGGRLSRQRAVYDPPEGRDSSPDSSDMLDNDDSSAGYGSLVDVDGSQTDDSDVSTKNRTESPFVRKDLNFFRNRCKRVMMMCSFLMKHSPRQESLKILSAAGHFFNGRPVRLTEQTYQLMEAVVNSMDSSNAKYSFDNDSEMFDEQKSLSTSGNDTETQTGNIEKHHIINNSLHDITKQLLQRKQEELHQQKSEMGTCVQEPNEFNNVDSDFVHDLHTIDNCTESLDTTETFTSTNFNLERCPYTSDELDRSAKYSMLYGDAQEERNSSPLEEYDQCPIICNVNSSASSGTQITNENVGIGTNESLNENYLEYITESENSEKITSQNTYALDSSSSKNDSLQHDNLLDTMQILQLSSDKYPLDRNSTGSGKQNNDDKLFNLSVTDLLDNTQSFSSISSLSTSNDCTNPEVPMEDTTTNIDEQPTNDSELLYQNVNTPTSIISLGFTESTVDRETGFLSREIMDEQLEGNYFNNENSNSIQKNLLDGELYQMNQNYQHMEHNELQPQHYSYEVTEYASESSSDEYNLLPVDKASSESCIGAFDPNENVGPASSSSPTRDDTQNESNIFPGLEDLLSEDFKAYMTSSGTDHQDHQFHLWSSDIVFDSKPSVDCIDGTKIDFESVLAAPNLDEALRKLEQGLQVKNMEEGQDKLSDFEEMSEAGDDYSPLPDALQSEGSSPDGQDIVDINLQGEEELAQDEEQVSYDIGDSDYVSMDDLQSSFKQSPENRYNDENQEMNNDSNSFQNKIQCQSNENDVTPYIVKNCCFDNIMGPAEKEIWGISDKCEENSAQVDSLGTAVQSNVRFYPRILTPGVPMSSIVEENEETECQAENEADLLGISFSPTKQNEESVLIEMDKSEIPVVNLKSLSDEDRDSPTNNDVFDDNEAELGDNSFVHHERMSPEKLSAPTKKTKCCVTFENKIEIIVQERISPSDFKDENLNKISANAFLINDVFLDSSFDDTDHLQLNSTKEENFNNNKDNDTPLLTHEVLDEVDKEESLTPKACHKQFIEDSNGPNEDTSTLDENKRLFASETEENIKDAINTEKASNSKLANKVDEIFEEIFDSIINTSNTEEDSSFTGFPNFDEHKIPSIDRNGTHKNSSKSDCILETAELFNTQQNEVLSEVTEARQDLILTDTFDFNFKEIPVTDTSFIKEELILNAYSTSNSKTPNANQEEKCFKEEYSENITFSDTDISMDNHKGQDSFTKVDTSILNQSNDNLLESFAENTEGNTSAVEYSDGFPVSLRVNQRKQYWDKILQKTQEIKRTDSQELKSQIKKPATFSQIYQNICNKYDKNTEIGSRQPSIRIAGIVNKWKNAFEKHEINNESKSDTPEKTNNGVGNNTVSHMKHYWNGIAALQSTSSKQGSSEKTTLVQKRKAGLVAKGKLIFENNVNAQNLERSHSPETIIPECKLSVSTNDAETVCNKTKDFELAKLIDTLDNNKEIVIQSCIDHIDNAEHQLGSPIDVPDASSYSPENTQCEEDRNPTDMYRARLVHITEDGYRTPTPHTILQMTNGMLCTPESTTTCCQSDTSEERNERKETLGCDVEIVKRVIEINDKNEMFPEEHKTRFQRAKMFFQILEKKDPISSTNRRRHRVSESFWKNKSLDLEKECSDLNENEKTWGSTPVLEEIDSNRTLERSSRKKKKRCGTCGKIKRKKVIESTSAPTSDTESNFRTSHLKNRQVFGGSERIAKKKVSERFHVQDLFKDVSGENYSSNGCFLKGIPHKQAVIASLKAIDSDHSHKNNNIIEGERNIASTRSPQNYQQEYPYIPTTPAKSYRPRTNLLTEDFITRQQLLDMEN